MSKHWEMCRDGLNETFDLCWFAFLFGVFVAILFKRNNMGVCYFMKPLPSSGGMDLLHNTTYKQKS